jgi:hypothetical protein
MTFSNAQIKRHQIECRCEGTGGGWFDLVVALRPQTPKRIRGGWSHYTDTSKPVDGGRSRDPTTLNHQNNLVC